MPKNAQRVEGKTRSTSVQFPATTRGYSMVKILLLNDAFSDFSQLEASPVEAQSLQQKGKKRGKRKGKKNSKN